MYEAPEGWESLLAPQGHAADAFEPVEEAFDLVTFLVEPPVDRLPGSAGIGVDLSGRAEIIGNEGA